MLVLELSTDMGSLRSEIRMVFAHLSMERENMMEELNGLWQVNPLQSPHLDSRLFLTLSLEKQYSFHPLDTSSSSNVPNLGHLPHVFLSTFTSPAQIQQLMEYQSTKLV